MSLSPTKILQRLQDLKVWQQSHEELLKKTKKLVNTSANVTTASDYQTIDGLSAFDSAENSPRKVENWESQVISPVKNFNELLEEKLAEDPGPVRAPEKPKKPFLRKGSGLKRFRVKPHKKPSQKDRPKRKTDSVTPLKAPNLSVQPRATWTKLEEEPEQHMPHTETPIPGEQTLYEKALEKELLIFEALEQKADNSSFCSTNSSVMHILSSTPSKLSRAPVTEEKRVHWESAAEDDDVIESTLDISEILQRLRKIAESKTSAVPTIAEEDEKWSTTEPSSEDTSISSTDLEVTLKTEKRDMGVGTHDENLNGCAICADKLEGKIAEYERKLHELMQDKSRISQITKNLEQKERELVKKKREFEDEKEDLLFDLNNEKKKLLKEKQVFQTYMKDSQNRPNKRERTEISNLKQEVADLTETLKLKDSKNGMTQARLRNQIKQLEKENGNLKDEIEKLTKENAKLAATQKLNRRPSDAKILHEISKNVSKLTQETIRNKKEEVGPEKSRKMDDSLIEMTIQPQVVNVEVQCETNSVEKTDTKQQHVLMDGSKQIKYPNGNVKTISPDGNMISVKYYNGDIKETNQILGVIKYFFSSENIWQTTFQDGVELIDFPNGVQEKRHLDGKREVYLPDDVIQTTFPDGTQETKYGDGSTVQIKANGDKTLYLPNGQKEIETKEYKRREYPDGTVKTLYPDGMQETRYSNGRLRIKDQNGTLVVDTHS